MSVFAADSVTGSPVQDTIHGFCRLCRDAITSGAGRFRVGDTEFHPRCFRFWLTTPTRRTDETGP